MASSCFTGLTAARRAFGYERTIRHFGKGKIANFLVADTDKVFTKAIGFETWIQGNRFIISNKENTNKDGVYHLTVNHDRRV
ncbi:MAG: hypothetical protein IPL35_05720 [Sphingobacteriales bacterium]|nr:hypothetical protein [Sphingobacteriales bacterium]